MTAPRIALIGNPNAGKSTLFNALTGGTARTGNYAGTTVDRHVGQLTIDGTAMEVLDVPGTWSLAARSPEERIAIDIAVGLGQHEPPALLVVVLDAPRVMRSLYVTLQLLDLKVPVVCALNLADEARQDGVMPDVDALAHALGVPVIATVARTGEGLQALRDAIGKALRDPASVTPGAVHDWTPALVADADALVPHLPARLRAVATDPARARALALWMLLSVDDDDALPDADVPTAEIARIRAAAKAARRDLQGEIIGHRYAWIDARANQFVPVGGPRGAPLADKIDRVLLHPLWGSLAFLAVMGLVFTSLFSWSDPLIGLIEALFARIGGLVAGGFEVAVASAPLGGVTAILGDLVVNGIIGGVGSVLVFIPQIGLLFFFLALLEDSGYLARAAQLMDRILRLAGLPGRAFVPLISGYACAVPAIMATRTMPRARDRLLTMAVLPLTSCSARLPVYGLMIGALYPALIPGTSIPARPVALFGMYVMSTFVTLLAALVLGRLVVPDVAAPDLIELPPYRLPHWQTVGRMVYARVADFVREAGGTILKATVVLWFLLSFPRYTPEQVLPPDVIAQAQVDGTDLTSAARGAAIERSFAGRIGHVVEPAIRPLGFDWRIGVGLVGAFAAREVFVSTMGVVYGLGDDVDDSSATLRDRLRGERTSDGQPRYTPLVATSLMVFFAFAFQCLSTLAVLRREAGGWRWAGFIVAYMTVLAWTASFAVYQGGLLLGFK